MYRLIVEVVLLQLLIYNDESVGMRDSEKRWIFRLVTWAHNTLWLGQSQPIFREANNKREITANIADPGSQAMPCPIDSPDTPDTTRLRLCNSLFRRSLSKGSCRENVSWVVWLCSFWNKVVSKITNPFPNFNGTTVEVWKWISNFISYFTAYDYLPGIRRYCWH